MSPVSSVEPKDLRPLRNYVIVEAEPFEDWRGAGHRASGIVIPETAVRPGLWRGRLLACGPGRWVNGAREALDVQPGQDVLFHRYEGQQLETGVVMQKKNGKVHYVIADTELIGILEE